MGIGVGCAMNQAVQSAVVTLDGTTHKTLVGPPAEGERIVVLYAGWPGIVASRRLLVYFYDGTDTVEVYRSTTNSSTNSLKSLSTQVVDIPPVIVSGTTHELRVALNDTGTGVDAFAGYISYYPARRF